MSATLIKLASSHRLSPVDGVDEKTGFILRFTQADGIKPHALSRHTTDSHFVPRWGERSLSLAFAFSDFSISAFSLWLHRADAWQRARHRHGSARARPDSPDFRPLHSVTRTAPPVASAARTSADISLRSDGSQIGETGGKGVRCPVSRTSPRICGVMQLFWLNASPNRLRHLQVVFPLAEAEKW